MKVTAEPTGGFARITSNAPDFCCLRGEGMTIPTAKPPSSVLDMFRRLKPRTRLSRALRRAASRLDRMEPGGIGSPLFDTQITDDMVRSHYGLPYPPRHFYMPIPDPQEIKRLDLDIRPMIPEAAWLDRPHLVSGLRDLEWLAPEIETLPDYFAITEQKLGLGFGEVEGLTYYAMIRQHKPDVILEIGSGVSTAYAAMAVERAEPGPRVICVEPFPAAPLRPFCTERRFRLIEKKVQDLDLAPLLRELTPASMVFIDTTHVLRADGDLPALLFRLLPSLPAGVLVHFHDIYFPWAVIDRHHDAFGFSHVWNETMALALMILDNPNWRIEHPGYWLAREMKEAYARVIPKAARTGQIGSSFWIRKMAAA